MRLTASPIIHVVDDEASVRRALGRLLKAHGYGVRTYGSVDEFLTRTGDDHPACVIVDLRMPGRTGLDLLGAVDATNGGVPVIMITGHGDQPMVAQAMNAGARHVLLKPFEDSALLGAIQRALTG